ncbi:MAG TPA: CaiB/BaiF CoA-transferase family protein [Candidatus Binataceae bacterium]|nr:CaiB/BaiF CoA-transferase family protein [Candidatus Binataceae bacterium]
MPEKPRHLLDGYKVLDFTHFVAGPTTTRLMAGMGAEIIKVEFAPHGDHAREFDYLRDKRSAFFVQQNRGKQSVCVDLRKPEGLEIVRGLVPKVDVVVENFAPGVITRMGLGYDVLKALNPGLVMCSISALGQTGPLANDPGFDFIGQAYAGITSLIGEEEGPPYMPMVAIGDVSAGAHAMGAIACALLYREKTGEGQYIDISLLDSYFHCHTLGLQLYSASKGKMEMKASGLHHSLACPAGVFRGKKWWIIILAMTDKQWVSVCEAMGRTDLAQDERYLHRGGRAKDRVNIVKIIEDWLAASPSDEASVEALRRERVPVAPILSVREAMEHPHLIERGSVRSVTDPILGEFKIPGFPLRFSGFPDEMEFDAPMLGEHNAAVLEKYLGYNAARVAELEKAGVLHHAPH